jgi:hypothetical protein
MSVAGRLKRPATTLPSAATAVASGAAKYPPSQHEDAGADHGADAECGEVEGAEGAAERRPRGLGLEVGYAAGSGEGHAP